MSSNLSVHKTQSSQEFGPILAMAENLPLRGTAAILEHARKRGFLGKKPVDVQNSALLNKLPRDILVAVTKFLDLKAVVRFTSTCKRTSLFSSQVFRERADAASIILRRYIKGKISELSPNHLTCLKTTRSLDLEEMIKITKEPIRKMVELCPQLREFKLSGKFNDEMLSELLPLKSQLASLTLDTWSTFTSEVSISPRGFETLSQFQKLKELSLDGHISGESKISTFSQLERLTLDGRWNDDNENILIQLGTGLKKLKELRFKVCYDSRVLKHLSLFSNLEILELDECTSDLFPHLATLKNLKELIIHEIRSRDGEEPHRLAELGTFPKLETLQITLAYRHDKTELSDFISKHTQLKKMVVGVSHSVSQEDFINAIVACRLLEGVGLVNFDLSGSGFQDLSQLENIQMIYFNSCKLPADALNTLSELRNLKSLGFDRCLKLNAEKVYEIQKLPLLTELCIQFCAGFEANEFAALVDKSPYLREIKLLGQAITNAWLQALHQTEIENLKLHSVRNVSDAGLQSLHGHKHLEVLKISEKTETSKAGRKALQESIPNLAITYNGKKENYDVEEGQDVSDSSSTSSRDTESSASEVEGAVSDSSSGTSSSEEEIVGNVSENSSSDSDSVPSDSDSEGPQSASENEVSSASESDESDQVSESDDEASDSQIEENQVQLESGSDADNESSDSEEE